MKSKEELIAYKQKIEMLYGRCEVLEAQKDSMIYNVEGTAGRKAEDGVSWIDYWRAMTGCHETMLACGSCGRVIYTDYIPKYMTRFYRLTGDSPESHLACGGHVTIGPPLPSDENYYIITLCPKCNSQRAEKIPIRQGTLICKELGAHIEGKD